MVTSRNRGTPIESWSLYIKLFSNMKDLKTLILFFFFNGIPIFSFSQISFPEYYPTLKDETRMDNGYILVESDSLLLVKVKNLYSSSIDQGVLLDSIIHIINIHPTYSLVYELCKIIISMDNIEGRNFMLRNIHQCKWTNWFEIPGSYPFIDATFENEYYLKKSAEYLLSSDFLEVNSDTCPPGVYVNNNRCLASVIRKGLKYDELKSKLDIAIAQSSNRKKDRLSIMKSMIFDRW